MGQKTHPIGFRLGVIKSWNSKWFAGSKFANFIYEDMMVKKYINARLDNAGLAKVEILRAPKKVTVDIHTSRPGIVIGRKGSEVDKLREELQLLTKKDISLNIIEVKKPELNARLVADSIARQLEGRVSYRRAMKKAIAASMKMGADGIKVVCGGRLAGAEIARSEKYMDGRVPLHTLRADIDYATSTAHTTYGCIGVKVWICRGMVHGAGEMAVKEEIDKGATERQEIEMPARRDRRRDDKSRKRRPRGRVRRPDARGDSRGEGGRPPRSEGSDQPRRDGDAGRGGRRGGGRHDDRPGRGDRREPLPRRDGGGADVRDSGKKGGPPQPKKDATPPDDKKS
ncbi:MAG: 30S ribosomal protein S3 [Candidatus Zixiibacteriota bacterium]